MHITRQYFIAATGAAIVVAAAPARASEKGKTSMYGLIGKIEAAPGQRDALISILL
jgi:hypothetical protein